MAYTRGSNANIIVGAAALFVTVNDSYLSSNNIPAFVEGESYKETLALRYSGVGSVAMTGPGDAIAGTFPGFRNVGYTNNGIEISFQPDFGEVMVDQLLDTAKIFKQGMKVTLKTTLAEATLENLLLSIAGRSKDLRTTYAETLGLITLSATSATANLTASPTNPTVLVTTGSLTVPTVYPKSLDLNSGELGDYPIERGLIAIGPGLYNKDGLESGTQSVNDQAERIYIAYRAVSIDQVTVMAKRDSATAFDVSFRLLPDDNGTYGKIVDRTF